MRQYISQHDTDEKGLLTIIGKDYRYMRQVLRLKAGDMVTVRVPDGSLKNMTVCRIDESSKKIILQICDQQVEPEKNQPEFSDDEKSRTEYWLFMFVPKSSKLDLIVRQATECGVSRVIPVLSEFSQQKIAEKMNFRGERFDRIIKEARQQSGSPVNTTVEDCVSVQKMCEMWQNEKSLALQEDSAAFGIVLYERSEFTSTLREALKTETGISENNAENAAYRKIQKCAVVCGAEGGISPEEIQMLLKSGFKAVHFKTNILRCETAALYGMAALQNAVSELEG